VIAALDPLLDHGTHMQRSCMPASKGRAAPRPPVLIPRFARDSLLEGAVRCELVSAAGPDTAPDEYLESIKKGGLLISCNQNLFYMVSMFLPEGMDS
jgi:hypothetical protein